MKFKQGQIVLNYQSIFVIPFLFLSLPPLPSRGSLSALQGHTGGRVLKMMRNNILSFKICKVYAESIQPCTMKKRHLLKKLQDTRHIVHRTIMPQSPSKKAPWDLTQFSQSPSGALSYLLKSHQQSGISSLSKVSLVLRKARSCMVPNLCCSGAESPE